jgi:hypothetical protein
MYGVIMAVIDPDARALVMKVLARVRRRPTQGGDVP